jgi:hypothetical protein
VYILLALNLIGFAIGVLFGPRTFGAFAASIRSLK